MKYIMKNHQTGWSGSEPIYEYCIYNDKNRTQSKIELTPIQAKKLKIKSISPYNAVYSGMMNFNRVKLEQF